MKISIIMPTYNDAETIAESLDSVLCQDYEDWELIIVNDGSTDNTDDIVNVYLSNNKIKYFYQKNAGQLNAVLTASYHISGDFVFILHSDDLLSDEKFFTNCVAVLDDDDCDGIFGNYILIDENGQEYGKHIINKYEISKRIPPKLLMNMGRNIYLDLPFLRTKVYVKHMLENYVKWNMPFWLYFDSNTFSQLRIKKVDFWFLKYRIHSQNYINTDLGKLNVVNGNLRTVTSLMTRYNIPLFEIQLFFLRMFNKLNIKQCILPLYTEKEFVNKASIVRNTIKYRVGKDYKTNIYLMALINFFNNFSNSNRILIEEKIKDSVIFMGKDMRRFNELLLDNKLPQIYYSLFEFMNKGFKEVYVKSEEDIYKMETILRFLNIGCFVNVKGMNEGGNF